MIKGIFTSAAGMNYLRLKQEVTANNMANVNTTGFKKDGVFSRLLRANEKILKMNSSDFVRLEIVDETRTDHSQGSYHTTGNPYDLAIEGEGFFSVQTPQGVMYTRNGSFMINQDNQLVTSNGYPVLGINGPVTIIGNDVFIGDDGSVNVDGAVVDVLAIVDFPKPYHLAKFGDGLFSGEAASAVNQTTDRFRLRQGVLEESNVEIIDEMVTMIQTTREFDAGQKAIQVQDSTLDRAVNEVGRVQR